LELTIRNLDLFRKGSFILVPVLCFQEKNIKYI